MRTCAKPENLAENKKGQDGCPFREDASPMTRLNANLDLTPATKPAATLAQTNPALSKRK
jgi:hypothetical protein